MTRVCLRNRSQFVADGVFFAELNEMLVRELAEDGYSGVEVRVTPMKTEIIIRATRTANVLGEKGRRIRELTSLVQRRFNFAEGTVELYAEKVNNRGLCAIAQCESLRYKLLGGLAVRRYVLFKPFNLEACDELSCTTGQTFVDTVGTTPAHYVNMDAMALLETTQNCLASS